MKPVHSDPNFLAVERKQVKFLNFVFHLSTKSIDNICVHKSVVICGGARKVTDEETHILNNYELGLSGGDIFLFQESGLP